MRIYKIRRLFVWTHRIFRFLVRTILVLLLCAAIFFLYLRLFGLPDFILKKVMQRVNNAGVPVSIERIVLTMGGWRADGIRYYSDSPDDLEPLFYVKTVYFSILKNPDNVGMNVDVDMLSVHCTPSVKWNIKIPKNSDVLHLQRVKAILSFSPKEILLVDGETTWLDFRFHINGKILKGKKTYFPKGLKQGEKKTFSFTEEQFNNLKKQLKIFNLPEGVDVTIDFLVDTEKYEDSSLNFSLSSKNFFIKKIPFSEINLEGKILNPKLTLDHFILSQGEQSIQLNGQYNWKNKKIKAWVFNSILSTRLLTFLPPKIKKQIEKYGFKINQLPQLNLYFGPTTYQKLLNHLKGTFSLNRLVYKGLMVEQVQGNVQRNKNRLEINNIQAKVRGQQKNSAKIGSALYGGEATGALFWDENTRKFGIEGDMNFDPNLLLKPLEQVKIATKIINYFKLKKIPPQAHIELGANVDNWKTFYLTIQATAENGSFRGVPFSSLNTKAVYKNYKLRLDPLSLFQDNAFLKGSALIDFHHSTAEFEGDTTLNPADIEMAIYPSSLHLFSDKIKLSGKTRISAEGVVDWSKTMKKMDFKANVSADHIKIPIGYAQNIKAIVVGKGPTIVVTNATLAICSGSGKGNFKIWLDKLSHSIPYQINASFSKINFKNMVMRYSNKPISATGLLSGKINLYADLATNFFDRAIGTFSIRIENGKLADLPLFKEFSKVIRFVIPKFKALSITRLIGDFKINNRKIASDNVLFSGDVISAAGRGSYSPKTGFDALVQAHILKKKGLLGIIDFVTSPFTKLFEMHLSGTMDKPVWRLGTFKKLKE